MDVIYTMDIGLLRMYAMAIPVLFSYWRGKCVVDLSSLQPGEYSD